MSFSSPLCPVVSIVIISFNTRGLTLRCLRELSADVSGWKPGEVEIFVVDNASVDGSADAIETEFPDVELLRLNENIGFGPANNRAFERASGEFFLLLNSDAFVHSGAIKVLVEFARTHPKAGAVGPKLLNTDGSLQVSCWKFPSPLRSWIEALGLARAFSSTEVLGDYFRWAHDQPRSVDFIVGACLLVRRETWEEVGGFDEAFFLYAEETDWQKRMQQAGWTIEFTPDAVVTHLGGASVASQIGRTTRLFWEGQERFIEKHFGPRGKMVYRGALVAGMLVRLPGVLGLLFVPSKHRAARERMRFWGWQLKRIFNL